MNLIEREPTELKEFLIPYPADIQELTLAGRMLFLKMLYPVSEIFYDANSAVCSGFTYTDKATGNFVNLAVFADHVTLIFPHGINLSDPGQRLKGEGNQVRHIRLAGLETLEDPYVVNLVLQASEQAVRPLEPLEPDTIVKHMKGVKRRPKAGK
jgi:hypothetical protein